MTSKVPSEGARCCQIPNLSKEAGNRVVFLCDMCLKSLDFFIVGLIKKHEWINRTHAQTRLGPQMVDRQCLSFICYLSK